MQIIKDIYYICYSQKTIIMKKISILLLGFLFVGTTVAYAQTNDQTSDEASISQEINSDEAVQDK